MSCRAPEPLALFPERDPFYLHLAKVHLAEAKRRRGSYVNRTFYWTLLSMVANARRKYVASGSYTPPPPWSSV